jgi:hypothetical protein
LNQSGSTTLSKRKRKNAKRFNEDGRGVGKKRKICNGKQEKDVEKILEDCVKTSGTVNVSEKKTIKLKRNMGENLDKHISMNPIQRCKGTVDELIIPLSTD